MSKAEYTRYNFLTKVQGQLWLISDDSVALITK